LLILLRRYLGAARPRVPAWCLAVQVAAWAATTRAACLGTARARPPTRRRAPRHPPPSRRPYHRTPVRLSMQAHRWPPAGRRAREWRLPPAGTGRQYVMSPGRPNAQDTAAKDQRPNDQVPQAGLHPAPSILKPATYSIVG
jgi:hypothetical protein